MSTLNSSLLQIFLFKFFNQSNRRVPNTDQKQASIELFGSNPRMCLDTMGHGLMGRVGTHLCHGQGGNQVFNNSSTSLS